MKQIKTKNFVRDALILSFSFDRFEDDYIKLNFLFTYLLRGGKKYSKEEFITKMNNLNILGINKTINEFPSKIVVDLSVTYISPIYNKTTKLNKINNFIKDILINVDINNKKLNNKEFKIVKDNFIKSYEKKLDNPSTVSYALYNKEINKNNNKSNLYTNFIALKKLNNKMIYDTYQRFRKESILNTLFFTGVKTSFKLDLPFKQEKVKYDLYKNYENINSITSDNKLESTRIILSYLIH